MPKAIIVDDDQQSLDALAEWVADGGFETTTASTVEAARESVAQIGPFDLAILDLQLPDGSGLELLDDMDAGDETEVVIVTGHASVDTAVGALRGGVVDYLTKPVDTGRLKKILSNVITTAELRQQVSELREELRSLGRFGRMVGVSSSMQEVYDLISRVAPTDSTVLVLGETGTGKELAAQTLHEQSRRAKRPFLPINCGAVPPNLIESELFGHERGSFTGADRRRAGIFERADGGTLFLDEITEMPLELQVKLLRVLESKKFARVGGDRMMDVDVRLIAASNRDPEKAVQEGKLREDLLYRLLVFPIHLPPLKDREEDVELLANTFLEQLNRGADVPKQLSPEAVEELKNHPWPGNVRELKNVIERAYILASDIIEPEHIPVRPPSAPSAVRASGNELRLDLGVSIAEAEQNLILATLEHLGGNKKKVADVLGISVKTLYNRLNSYGVDLRPHKSRGPGSIRRRS
jgi:DNA-binding NtrC family response regulator